jgi:hypothetical protein
MRGRRRIKTAWDPGAGEARLARLNLPSAIGYAVFFIRKGAIL